MKQEPLRVLSISSVFPRPGEENLGLFVRGRLAALKELAEVKVVSPVPWLDVSRGRMEVPSLPEGGRRMVGNLEARYPHWLYPPGLGAMNGLFMAAALVFPLRRIRNEFTFEIIDAHFGHPEGIAAGVLAGIFKCPYAVTLRGNETMHGARGLKRRLMSAALQGASAVICVSRSLRDFAVGLGVDPSKLHVVPNGVDGDIFRPAPRAETRDRLGMERGAFHILSAGYLIERKGHHRIAEVLPELHAQGICAHLWVVGGVGREAGAEERIRQAASRSGLEAYVHLTGSVAPRELAAYMSACDVFCLASDREGWPNVVNEALASGAPVVAFNVGGVPEMIPNDRYGMVLATNSREALAGGLRAALEREWDREAIAEWGSGRSWDHVAREVDVILRRAAGRELG